MLFVLQNLARHLDVEPESALKRTNRKFRSRFKFIERELKNDGKSLEKASLEEMDLLWDRSKKISEHNLSAVSDSKKS